MDTKKDDMIAKCGEEAEHRRIVGAKQIRKALERGQVMRVFLARNADPAITAALAAQCEAQQIPYTWAPDMQTLGRLSGIEVGAAAAAVLA